MPDELKQVFDSWGSVIDSFVENGGTIEQINVGVLHDTLEDTEKDFTIRKEDGEFIVEGNAVENLMRRVNIGDNESFAYLQKMLRRLGIEEELRTLGIQEGDGVKILDWEFEWYE